MGWPFFIETAVFMEGGVWRTFIGTGDFTEGRVGIIAEEGWTREKGSQTRELVETAVFTEVVSGCGSGLDRSENESDKGRTEEGGLEVTWQRG